MATAIHALGKPRFGQDTEIGRTRRFTLLPPTEPGNQALANSISLTDLGKIAVGAGGILWESRQKDKADEFRASREVAGVRLELGGKKDYTAKDVKADRFFGIGNAVSLVFESVMLFLKKIYWLATKSDSPGVKKIWSDLSGGGGAAQPAATA